MQVMRREIALTHSPPDTYSIWPNSKTNYLVHTHGIKLIFKVGSSQLVSDVCGCSEVNISSAVSLINSSYRGHVNSDLSEVHLLPLSLS